jgi:hypothetical protein
MHRLFEDCMKWLDCVTTSVVITRSHSHYTLAKNGIRLDIILTQLQSEDNLT